MAVEYTCVEDWYLVDSGLLRIRKTCWICAGLQSIWRTCTGSGGQNIIWRTDTVSVVDCTDCGGLAPFLYWTFRVYERLVCL